MLHVKYGIRDYNRELRIYLDVVYSRRLQLLDNGYDMNSAYLLSPAGEIGIIQIRDLTKEFKRMKFYDKKYRRRGIKILDFKIGDKGKRSKEVCRELRGVKFQ